MQKNEMIVENKMESESRQVYQPRSRFEDKNGKCMICGYDYDVWPCCDHPGCHDGR